MSAEYAEFGDLSSYLEGSVLRYNKDYKSISELADRLKSQGLLGEKSEIEEKLKHVNYYRLKLYWHPYRTHIKDDEYRFSSGITFEFIWNLYRFDRRMRLLILDGIERIEVSIRTLISHIHSREYGMWGYLNLDKNTFLMMGRDVNVLGRKRRIPEYAGFLSAVLRLVNQNTKSEDFIKHHFDKYKPDQYLPFWIVAEVMDYGTMYQAFKGLDIKLKREIANTFSRNKSKISWQFLYSWLDTLRYVRNICAHHSRLWNRILTKSPPLPRNKGKTSDIWSTCRPQKDKVYSVLCIINYMLGFVIPKSGWKMRLFDLFNEFDIIPLQPMGIPPNWKDSDIWKSDVMKTITDGLKDKYRQAIIGVLKRNPKVSVVILFGSRAAGSFRPGSDIDLAIKGDNLTLNDLAEINEQLERLTIPHTVDIVIYNQIENERLLSEINNNGVMWLSR